MSEDAIREAFRKMSPSAPYDLRRKAIAWANEQEPYPSGERAHWWNQYPEGSAAAFIFRLAYLLGSDVAGFAPWEESGHELPESRNIDPRTEE